MLEGLNSLLCRIAAQSGGAQLLDQLAVLAVERGQASVIFFNLGSCLGNGGLVIRNRLLLFGALLAQCLGGALVGLHIGENVAVTVTAAVSCALQHRDANADVGGIRLCLTDIGKRGGNISLQHRDLGTGGADLVCNACLLCLQRTGLLSQLQNACGVLTAGGLLLLHILLRERHGGGSRLNELLGMCNIAFGDAEFAVQRVVFLRLLTDLGQQLLGCHLVGLRSLKQTVILLFHGLQGVLCILQIKCRVTECLLCHADFIAESLGIVQPQADVSALFGLHELNGALCLTRFLFKRADLCLHLGKHVHNTNHVFLGLGQLSLGLVLFVTELCNTRGILKGTAAFVTLTRNHFCNTALTDDGITVSADTRIHKQLVNIAQSDRAAVDEIFTLSLTEVASCDGYLVVGAIQLSKIPGVVKGHGYLCIAHGTAAVGTAEDNVLHLGATQGLGRDFAQYPTHRVRDVGLTASVGADDNRNACLLTDHAVIKDQLGSVREGFEAL